MELDDVERRIADQVRDERESIVAPTSLAPQILAVLAAPLSQTPRRLSIPVQLAMTAAVLTLVGGIAFGGAWLRNHKQQPPNGRLPVAISTSPSVSPGPSPSGIGVAPSASASATASAVPSASASARSSAGVRQAPVTSAAPTTKAPLPAPTPFNPGYTVPDAAAGSAMGYDPVGGYPILANQQVRGGAGFETWKWNGSQWVTLVRGGTSPYAASNIAYDPSAGMPIVVHGSQLLGWNGSGWLNWLALPAPVLGQPYLAYDQARSELILIDSNSGGAVAVTWIHNSTGWKKADSVSGPAGHFGSGVAYDPRSGVTVLFGGAYMNQSFGDTWTWNGSSWTRRQTVISPPAGPAVMAYDQANAQMVLLAANGTSWVWSGSTWSKLASPSPPLGAYASLAYDPGYAGLFLWEGSGGYEQGSQTWSYAAGIWTRRS